MKGVVRTWVLVAAGAMSLAACRDNGLPDRNLPLQDARHRTYGYPTYEPVAGNAPVDVGGRHWMASLPVQTIPARLLVPVGGSDVVPLYALRGEQAPYSTLYAQMGPDRWRPYLRIN